MNLSLCLYLGLLLSAGIFCLTYSAPEEVAMASTDYNATSRGLFGWEYSYSENRYISQGSGALHRVVHKGREIRYPNLIAEVVVCCVLGLGAAGVVRMGFSRPPSRPVSSPSEW
jgi:hypothetical protein